MTTATTPPATTTDTVALPIASLWRRLLASLVDACIYMVIATIALGAIWLISGEPLSLDNALFAPITDETTTADLWRSLRDSFVLVLAWLIYTGVLTSRQDGWNGRTVGKNAAGLRIVQTDGSPLPARQAWKRAILAVLLVNTVTKLGTLADIIWGDPPTGTNAAIYASAALYIATFGPVVLGGVRQTLYDRWAGTVVVDEPKYLPRLEFLPQTPNEPSLYQPLAPQPATSPYAVPQRVFTQPPAQTVPGEPFWNRFGPVAVVPRPRSWKTWTAVGLTALGSLAFAASTPLMNDIAESFERAEKIKELPETKAALADLRELEKLGERCLATGQQPEQCDEADELGATGMTFADDFDLQNDPIGAHAGKVGAVASGDHVTFYGFTSDDRIWSTISGGGWADRTCIKHDGALCDDFYGW